LVVKREILMSEEMKVCRNGPWQQITNGVRCSQCGFQEVDLHPIATRAHARKSQGWIGGRKRETSQK
jgi:hypothetical protein